MEVRLPIFQIVGYQNSGKTTLVQKLVKNLSKRGYKVGTIKHHGHGGEPDFADKGKDSALHRSAGARVVTVEGNGTIQLTASELKWDLQQIISLYESFNLDIILVEGYKLESYPKVVLLRTQEDLEMTQKLSNIFCVISQVPLLKHQCKNLTWFLRSEEEAYLSFLLQEVGGHSNE
ncbi:molybdopterin-guanine dinucleotide biosynthesis protein B [Bacillus mesophilus]|uniref:Molybdopterin-guanine dinucleotide biosynthesis protein B n=2 Tax=Bacillus mesophilus TaxID=1808955 RepID=A0A6M0QBJ2_9BACI|nr:molybdopterin-guanine dinucleotide biosynthesis protein B [Bacillus mesophilus]MBM7663063.1 molybdopterin-guanine dinucleotide biosynthesis protein B [Bacillus mesophilus]NEY73617.1 molybdopterin-guanine dinucleotide biosynthesis protein B [Bacillus mesophilus]